MAIMYIACYFLIQGIFKDLSRVFIKVTGILMLLTLMTLIFIAVFCPVIPFLGHLSPEKQSIPLTSWLILPTLVSQPPLPKIVGAYQNCAGFIVYSLYMMAELQGFYVTGVCTRWRDPQLLLTHSQQLVKEDFLPNNRPEDSVAELVFFFSSIIVAKNR